MMWPERCCRITGRTAFVRATGPKKLGLELGAEFFEFNVLGEASHGESGVVDEGIDAAIVADDGIDEVRDRRDLGYVEAAYVDPVGDSCGIRSFIEFCPAGQIAHGGDDFVASFAEFYGGEQAESAGGASEDSDFVRHSSYHMTRFLCDPSDLCG